MKVKYPKIDLRARCHWVSKTTGEIIRASCAWRGAHWLAQPSVCNAVWFYNKKGR